MLKTIKIDSIKTNPQQPRERFGDLENLAHSIETYGLQQAIKVTKINGGYQLKYGERRLRACKLLGKEELVIDKEVIIDNSKTNNLEIALIENLMRKDLDKFETAAALNKLMIEVFKVNRPAKKMRQLDYKLQAQKHEYIKEKPQLNKNENRLLLFIRSIGMSATMCWKYLELLGLPPPIIMKERKRPKKKQLPLRSLFQINIKSLSENEKVMIYETAIRRKLGVREIRFLKKKILRRKQIMNKIITLRPKRRFSIGKADSALPHIFSKQTYRKLFTFENVLHSIRDNAEIMTPDSRQKISEKLSEINVLVTDVRAAIK